ncbi:hypothetical protein Tco_0590715 [Tanacetum coccineum]
MVLREPNSGKYQPLLKVQGKGKEKVVDEQDAHDLHTLQTSTKKSPVDQFIFQRRPPTHTEPTGQAESPSLDAELPLTDSETKSDEEVPMINAGDHDEGQARTNPGEQDEGQARPNPGIQDEGQARSNPGDAAESQPQPTKTRAKGKRPVVLRDPDSGKYQLLHEVQGKGKEKVVDEQVAHDLVTLQTPTKMSPVDQFIFQRHPPTHTEPTGQAESPSLDVKLPLTDSETESDEEVPMINAGDHDEGQARTNPGEQDEGQARPNPEATDASSQQKPKQMDEEFTTTAYPNVQENLKLPTEDQVILEEPATKP